MTQEDKQLLLKDICARLPYKVKGVYARTDIKNLSICEITTHLYGKMEESFNGKEKYEFIPYLFPLSSMTEEQRKEFLSVAGYERKEEDCGRHTETYYYDMVGHEHEFYPNSDAIDYCNKNHFDYRGLIEKGLAIDATGLNIY